jgi:hypothetical protein
MNRPPSIRDDVEAARAELREAMRRGVSRERLDGGDE